MDYCSLQHQTLLSPPGTSKTECRFCFGPFSSFFLELFLCSSPVDGHLATWWACLPMSSFYLFMLFMGFLRQEYCSVLSFPSPVDHVLSDLSTNTQITFCQNSPPWPRPHFARTLHDPSILGGPAWHCF